MLTNCPVITTTFLTISNPRALLAHIRKSLINKRATIIIRTLTTFKQTSQRKNVIVTTGQFVSVSLLTEAKSSCYVCSWLNVLSPHCEKWAEKSVTGCLNGFHSIFALVGFSAD